MKYLGIAIVVLLVSAGAVLHGAATYRWAAISPVSGKADAIHDHTIQVGDFNGAIVPTEFEIKEKSRVTCREYKSPTQPFGAMVSVTSGPPGAVATHAPDVCYPTSGYRTVSAPKKETVTLPGGTTINYFVAVFEKKSGSQPDRQRVRWAWAVPGGKWEAPDRARFAYLREPELFKLYVVTPLPVDDADRPADDSPAVKTFVAAAFAQYTGLVAGSR